MFTQAKDPISPQVSNYTNEKKKKALEESKQWNISIPILKKKTKRNKQKGVNYSNEPVLLTLYASDF